jgi:drug/metabolite transporter (DMT)-like permease
MRWSDLIELVALAALWGAAFLFMRTGAGEFGPVALAALRVTGAALVLMPLLAAKGHLAELRTHWRVIGVIGILNSALPFLLFSYAALFIPAGLSAIFNAASPLFAAAIGWLWLHDRLSAPRVAGLVIGFVGVLGLMLVKLSPGNAATANGVGGAMVACIAAAALYGLSANVAKRHLSGVAPLAVAAGSQVSAALFLAAPEAWWRPTQAVSSAGWVSAAVLALACTGVAYLLYFRLIANAGAANAIAVTFLIPLFAVLWGRAFLSEALTPAMVIGCGVILLGTGLTTGLLRTPK